MFVTLEILQENDWKYSENVAVVPGDKDSLIIKLAEMMHSLKLRCAPEFFCTHIVSD